uniref:Endoplasmic reticulum lectin 1 n=1 Tax=Echinostoma caproni TaxID=27848 RepID=A0A183BFL2_9TREM
LQTKDWWTYELCYGKKISQFHEEREERLSETVLGYYESETIWNETVDFVSMIFQFYTNGSVCDLTSKPRSSEVRYTCGNEHSPEIISVNELESCIYLLTVEVPSLCAHPAFVVTVPPKVEEILCGVVPDGETQSHSGEVFTMSQQCTFISENKTVPDKGKPISSTSKESVPNKTDVPERIKRIYTLQNLYSVSFELFFCNI